tara:strand:+ start:7193 stop:8485 length:1293 start_codon:yes stop_codon:yes gene_type:complete
MTKIYIKTFGCAVNRSDSEVMAGVLVKAGYNVVDDVNDMNRIDNADIVIVNTCIVKGPSERNVLKFIKKGDELGKKVIVSGCITKTNPKELLQYSLVSPKNVSQIDSVVEESVKGNIVHLVSDDTNPRLNLPKVRKNKIIEIIPICAGCLGACAYCIVKKARGGLVSYSPDAIIEQAMSAVKSGVKEIWITAQDTGAYGYDIGTNVCELLLEIVKIKGDFKVRLGMINPNHALAFVDDLISVFKSDKMFKFIHLPVQSGNNKVLSNMNRKYSVEDFKLVIEKLRKEIPDITISTDIICGFPGESSSHFNDTIELIKWLKPCVLNISKFWSRKGTSAHQMENKVDGIQIKQRSHQLAEVFKEVGSKVNETWMNWTGDILIDEIGKDNSFVGRNYSYRPIIIKGDYKVGDVVKVKINDITWFDLRGIKFTKE